MNIPDRGPICYPELRVYDPSSLALFETCPYQYYMRYERKLVSSFATTSALVFGGAIHEAIATLLQKEWDLPSALKSYEDYPGIREVNDKHRTFEKGQALVEAYRERWKDELGYPVMEMQGKKIVEEAFIMPLGEGFSLAGRIDCVTLQKEQIWPMDHKTTSSMYYLTNQMRPNLQFDLYSWAASKLFGTCGGLILDAMDIGKKGGFEFARVPTPRSEYELGKAQLTALHHAKMIEWCRQNDCWTTFRNSCFKWNRQCDYANVCMHGIENGLVEVEVKEER